jgi:hypothetical protein
MPPSRRTWRFGRMAFRKVGVTEIREVLRSWLAGARLRKVAGQAGLDHEAGRRYVEAADARDGGAGQLPDELVGQVAGPHRFRRYHPRWHYGLRGARTSMTPGHTRTLRPKITRRTHPGITAAQAQPRSGTRAAAKTIRDALVRTRRQWHHHSNAIRPAAAGTRSGNDPTTRQRCLSSPPAKSDLASCKPVARALGQLRDGSWVLPVPNDAPLPRTSTRTARSWHRSACSGLR